MAIILGDRSPYRGYKPSQTMDLENDTWKVFTDPTLDPELAMMHRLVQLVDEIPPEDRQEMYIAVGMRFGLLGPEAVMST